MTLVPETLAVEPVRTTPSTAGPVKSSRFTVVDALRGVAALWVVIVHVIIGHQLDLLKLKAPVGLVDFLVAGQVPVSIFFVLSGFVIAYSVSRYEVNARFVGRFALRRVIRLDPPYWASIALVVGLWMLSGLIGADKSGQMPTVKNVLLHLFYLQEFTNQPVINPVYWTLCLEVQFYLVFCWLLALAHRFRRDAADRRSLYLIFVPALLFSAAWPLHLITTEWPLHGIFLPSWYGFLIGMTACWAMLGVVPPGVFYAYVLLIGTGAALHPDINVITCLVTSVLLYVASRRGTLSSWLNWRWLLFLGTISYSLYLIHNPVTGAFYRVAYRLTGRTAATEAFWFLPMIAANVVCAFGFWWLFERTSIALGHRVRMNPPSKPEPPEIEPPSPRI